MFWVATDENIIVRGFKSPHKAAKWARKHGPEDFRILDGAKNLAETPEEELLTRKELAEALRLTQKRRDAAEEAHLKQRDEHAAEERRKQNRLIDAGLVPIEVLKQYLGDIRFEVNREELIAPFHDGTAWTSLQMEFHPRILTTFQPGEERPADEEPFSRLVARLRRY